MPRRNINAIRTGTGRWANPAPEAGRRTVRDVWNDTVNAVVGTDLEHAANTAANYATREGFTGEKWYRRALAVYRALTTA